MTLGYKHSDPKCKYEHLSKLYVLYMPDTTSYNYWVQIAFQCN